MAGVSIDGAGKFTLHLLAGLRGEARQTARASGGHASTTAGTASSVGFYGKQSIPIYLVQAPAVTLPGRSFRSALTVASRARREVGTVEQTHPVRGRDPKVVDPGPGGARSRMGLAFSSELCARPTPCHTSHLSSRLKRAYRIRQAVHGSGRPVTARRGPCDACGPSDRARLACAARSPSGAGRV